MDKSTQILVMRHAESTYNRMQLDHAASIGEDDKFEEPENRWKNDPNVVDALLSELGKKQCEEARKVIAESYKGIKYVFVSPMRRASLTAILSLENYPTSLEWHAMPWFREILLSQCDIGYYCLDMLKKDYPFIDVSELKDNPIWFMDHYITELDPVGHAEKLKALHSEKPDSQTVIDYFRQHFPNLENARQMYKRIDKVKEHLREFIRKKKEEGVEVKDDEILIVGHSRIIRFLYGAFTLEGEVIEGKDAYFKNAEIRPFSLDH